MVLILGEQYGAAQASGLSATHEEFDEAREHCPVFVFVREGTAVDPQQATFIKEARDWQSGRYTASFTSREQLQQRVTTALHRWEVERASGSADAEEMIGRADALLKEDGRSYSGGSYSGVSAIRLAISAGPRRAVLRPADLEAPKLRDELHQMALFGRARLFVPEEGVKAALEGDTLVLRQKEAFLSLNGEGSISLSVPPTEGRDGITAIIEENVQETIAKALLFAAAVLDTIDPVERLTHIAIALRLRDGGYRGWRT
jgi:hypothetical protein